MAPRVGTGTNLTRIFSCRGGCPRWRACSPRHKLIGLLVEDGALYAALYRMEERGWIAAEWGTTENNRRARFYRLTADGRKALRAQATTWGRYAEAVGKVLEAEAR